MKRILVTGGFGFLGGHLVERLLEDPDTHVHVVDSLVTNPIPLEDLLAEIDGSGRRGEGSKLTWTVAKLETYCRENGHSFHSHVDEVYHLASVVGPAGVIPHSGRIAFSILRDALTMATMAESCGAKLLDVSTSEVYGGGVNGLCSEDMAKVVPAASSPRLEYAVGKLAAETALLNLHVATGLDVRIVRPFNITGPRQSGKGGFVLPRFIGQALAGVPLTIFGTGLQLRAFTHVRDMVEGIVLAMRHPAMVGKAINLGNPDNKCSILQLALEVKEATGRVGPIHFMDPKKIWGPLYEEANEKFPDWGRAKELGWSPSRDRARTIADTVAYMKGLSPDRLQSLRGF